jgi:hypothetical protein
MSCVFNYHLGVVDISEWYDYAQKTLQQYQNTDVRAEESYRERQRAAVREEIKDQVADLRSKFSDLGKVEFVCYVYKTYPPLNPKHKLGAIPKKPSPKDINKLLQKAVIHYHPDRVDAEVHGMKVKMLMEEITKYLTQLYECVKGMPVE